MKRTYSQIDMDERRKIARWRMAGISVDVIAEKLHRDRFGEEHPAVTKIGSPKT